MFIFRNKINIDSLKAYDGVVYVEENSVLYDYLSSYKNITTKTKLEEISICLILGGLVGNLADRILKGGVIDFLEFQFFGYSYPVFNLADVFLVIGVMLYIYQEVRMVK